MVFSSTQSRCYNAKNDTRVDCSRSWQGSKLFLAVKQSLISASYNFGSRFTSSDTNNSQFWQWSGVATMWFGALTCVIGLWLLYVFWLCNREDFRVFSCLQLVDTASKGTTVVCSVPACSLSSFSMSRRARRFATNRSQYYWAKRKTIEWS